MHVHERLRRHGRGGQRVALRLDLGQPRPDRQQQVAVADPLRERGVEADADVAGVARARVVDDVLAAERRADREPARERPARERLRRVLVPRPAADEHERPLPRPRAARPAPRSPPAPARGAPPGSAARRARRPRADSTSSGSASTTGPGPPARRHRVRAREHLGDPLGVVDLERPLRHRPEHGLVVELLEGLAPALLARHLPDQHQQRRRVLLGGVDAGRRVRRPRAARDEAESRAAGELAVGVGGVGGGALVAAVDDPERVAVLVEPVEQREVGLARHAERELGAVRDEPVRQHLSARPHVSDPTGGDRYRRWWHGDPAP